LHADCLQATLEDVMETSSQMEGYDRVRAHVSKKANARVDRLTRANLERASKEPWFATERLAELDREWDLDRAIMLGFAGAGTAALVLGLRRNWRWRFPLTAQVAFLLLHSVVGWCPPAVVLRRLGFRTRQEIEAERTALLRLGGTGVATSSA
jgi:hypothetical protein